MGSSTREDFRAHFFFYNIMDKTYVFSNEPSGGCSGGKLDIMALLPNLCGNKGVDPNLLLALNNGYRNQDMWGGAGIWWIWILLLFGWGRGGFGGPCLFPAAKLRFSWASASINIAVKNTNFTERRGAELKMSLWLPRWEVTGSHQYEKYSVG